MRPASRRAKYTRLLKGRGQWQPFMPAAQVADKIRALKAGGATLATISAATGVSVPALFEITSGQRQQVRTETAQKILAANQVQSGRRTTEANGTMWRLRSLQAMGHDSATLAEHMSARAGRQVHQETVRRLLAGEASRVQPDVCEAARGTWNALWDRTPPEETQVEKRNAARARGRAQRENWPTPMALDEERIDTHNWRPNSRQTWLPAEGVATARPVQPQMQLEAE
jgi:hypothetical protein